MLLKGPQDSFLTLFEASIVFCSFLAAVLFLSKNLAQQNQNADLFLSENPAQQNQNADLFLSKNPAQQNQNTLNASPFYSLKNNVEPDLQPNKMFKLPHHQL